MAIDVRHAALSTEVERRLRLAVRTLAAFGREAHCTAWDGTRCQLVVADARDSYGARVIELATRRGTPVLALGAGSDHIAASVTVLPEDVSPTALTRALQQALTIGDGYEENPPTPAPAQSATVTALPTHRATAAVAGDSGLQRLALNPAHATGDVLARLGSRSVYLLRSRGRVLSSSLSDQLEARNHLGGNGWQFSPTTPEEAARARAEVGASLDVFLLRAALRAEASLSPFPETPSMLREWPDLGSAPDLLPALRVSGALVRDAVTPAQIAASTGTPAGQISACLWAFKACGLLIQEQLAGSGRQLVARSQSARIGLIARLASHFGIGG